MRFWNKFCKWWVCIKDAMLLCSFPATCIADGLKAGVVVSQEELCIVLCSVYWVGWRSTLLYDCPWLFWLSFHTWFIRWYLAQRVGRGLGKLLPGGAGAGFAFCSKFATLTFVRHSFGLPALPYKAPLNAAGVLRPGQTKFCFLFLHTSCQVQFAHPE